MFGGKQAIDACILLQAANLCVALLVAVRLKRLTRALHAAPRIGSDDARVEAPRRPRVTAFDDMNAADLAYDRPVVTVGDDATPDEVLAAMTSASVSCAIMHSSADAVAVVDLTDVTVFMLRPNVSGIADEHHARVRSAEFVSGTQPMLHVLRSMCDRSARYAAVRNLDGTVGIVSQGAVVRFLLDREGSAPVFAQTLSECKLGVRESVLSYPADANVRDAFRQMLNHNITSVPLTDRAGAVLAIMSVSDIKLFAHTAESDRAEALALPSIEFLRRSRASVARNGDRPYREVGDLVTFQLHETLGVVLRRMVDANVHHIYSLGDGKTVVGVVSFIDVLRYVLSC